MKFETTLLQLEEKFNSKKAINTYYFNTKPYFVKYIKGKLWLIKPKQSTLQDCLIIQFQ